MEFHQAGVVKRKLEENVRDALQRLYLQCCADEDGSPVYWDGRMATAVYEAHWPRMYSHMANRRVTATEPPYALEELIVISLRYRSCVPAHTSDPGR
jgi:hypothetical protein